MATVMASPAAQLLPQLWSRLDCAPDQHHDTLLEATLATQPPPGHEHSLGGCSCENLPLRDPGPRDPSLGLAMSWRDLAIAKCTNPCATLRTAAWLHLALPTSQAPIATEETAAAAAEALRGCTALRQLTLTAAVDATEVPAQAAAGAQGNGAVLWAESEMSAEQAAAVNGHNGALSAGVAAAVTAALPALTALHTLRLHLPPHSAFSAASLRAALRQLPALRVLEPCGSHAAFPPLPSPQVEWLPSSACGALDASGIFWPHASALTALRELTVAHGEPADVRDGVERHAVPLPHVTTLHVRHLRVAVRRLPPLLRAVPALRSLHITCKLSIGVAAFATALSTCTAVTALELDGTDMETGLVGDSITALPPALAALPLAALSLVDAFNCDAGGADCAAAVAAGVCACTRLTHLVFRWRSRHRVAPPRPVCFSFPTLSTLVHCHLGSSDSFPAPVAQLPALDHCTALETLTLSSALCVAQLPLPAAAAPPPRLRAVDVRVTVNSDAVAAALIQALASVASLRTLRLRLDQRYAAAVGTAGSWWAPRLLTQVQFAFMSSCFGGFGCFACCRDGRRCTHGWKRSCRLRWLLHAVDIENTM